MYVFINEDLIKNMPKKLNLEKSKLQDQGDQEEEV